MLGTDTKGLSLFQGSSYSHRPQKNQHVKTDKEMLVQSDYVYEMPLSAGFVENGEKIMWPRVNKTLVRML